MIESGLHDLIVASSEFEALAETRLYPVQLPSESALPAATYQVVFRNNVYTLDGEIALRMMRLQIDVWANAGDASSYSQSKQLAATIEETLSGFSGVLSDGSFVDSVQLISSVDSFEAEASIIRVMTEYRIQYRPPVS